MIYEIKIIFVMKVGLGDFIKKKQNRKNDKERKIKIIGLRFWI